MEVEGTVTDVAATEQGIPKERAFNVERRGLVEFNSHHQTSANVVAVVNKLKSIAELFELWDIRVDVAPHRGQ